ncbi:MAG TPA: hypothetical protein VMR25_22685 [Planctomycetaceae bacterium]|jgi:AmiR/NasT family two-component response regulator|nr:hypothetical protein [Planctomycetaceae bacterium]
MTGRPARRDVLLVAADLTERRLLFAELLEACYEMMPVPGMGLALGALLQGSVEPRLILLDVQGDEQATPQSVEHLLTLISGVPLILVVGSIDRSSWESVQPRVAALLARPITIGGIIETVKQTLPFPNRIP